jgi:hypothetical protein
MRGLIVADEAHVSDLRNVLSALRWGDDRCKSIDVCDSFEHLERTQGVWNVAIVETHVDSGLDTESTHELPNDAPGLRCIRHLRRQSDKIIILALTTRWCINDDPQAANAGADDFLSTNWMGDGLDPHTEMVRRIQTMIDDPSRRLSSVIVPTM